MQHLDSVTIRLNNQSITPGEVVLNWLTTGLMAVFACMAVFRLWAAVTVTDPLPSQTRLSQQVRQHLDEATSEQWSEWLFDRQPLEIPLSTKPETSNASTQTQKVYLELQQFDSDAVVAILPGVDGKPGVAGVDDNGNGVTDDRSELGATQSDDRCETIDADHLRLSERKPFVLQRGAFVSVSSSTQWNPDAEFRVVVIGKLEGESWSFILPDSLIRSAQALNRG